MALREQESAPEELLAALGPALAQASVLDDKSRTSVALTRLLLGGATAEDYDQLMVHCLNRELPIVAIAVPQDRKWRQRLVEAAIDSGHDASDRLNLMDILCAAEGETPSSARAEILRICSAWLEEKSPMVRLLALETIGEFGWIEPTHLQPLLALLDGPVGTGWGYYEPDFRRHCAELILQHFPERAPAVHGPLLAVLRLQEEREPARSVPLLMQAACPRAPLLAGIRAALERLAQIRGLGLYDMRKLRSTLVEHGLFADLATDFTDIALGCIYQFTSTELAYIVPSDELRMEPGPRKYTDQSGKLVERQRLKHVPALLAGALARRLGVGEDVVQALWTTVGQHDDHCAAAFHQVVQRATTDPVLRPFTQALVERWGLEQAASC